MQPVARLVPVIWGVLSLASSAITPEQAAECIGKSGAVDGIALQVGQASGHVFVNFGARYPNQIFTAFVSKQDVGTVGLDYLRSMEGKPVSVVGRITRVKGKPQIQITKRDQIIATTRVGPR